MKYDWSDNDDEKIPVNKVKCRDIAVNYVKCMTSNASEEHINDILFYIDNHWNNVYFVNQSKMINSFLHPFVIPFMKLIEKIEEPLLN